MTPVMKLIKFDLPINGLKVKTLEELRNNLTDELIVLARSGQLTRWLAVRKHHQEAESVSAAVANHAEQISLYLALCESIGVQVDAGDVATMFNPPPPAGSRLKKSANVIDELNGLNFKRIVNMTEVVVPEGVLIGSRILHFYYKVGDKIKINHVTALIGAGSSNVAILSPASGVICHIGSNDGAAVTSGQVIAYIRPC
jgi:biotin carboxyl carrier protein